FKCNRPVRTMREKFRNNSASIQNKSKVSLIIPGRSFELQMCYLAQKNIAWPCDKFLYLHFNLI
ncbi:MAG: hypothetical protein P1P88_15615, partial [Bacteroidales bacterium]|nr:hypothetical protein [Bacteroidales bacterium]